MRFLPTPLAGVVRIEPEPHHDARGLFARLFCPRAWEAAGLPPFTPVQMNVSRNPTAFTLRGMHLQDPPHAEAKLVRVTRGRIFDVALDLRTDSPSFRCWTGVELDAAGMEALFIPEGCAHGFLTLEPDTDVLYLMGRLHVPDQGRGVRWDDPAFRIAWPRQPVLIDGRDAGWPDWSP